MMRDRYRDLFENSSDAILIIVGEKFVDCNEATVKMLRYKDKQELLDTHPSQLSPERQPDGRLSFEKANEMIEIAFREGSNRFEWDHMRADGEVFPVEVLLTAMHDREQPVLHVVWREISDRKKAEEALQKYHDQLEKLVEDRTAELISSNQQLALEKKRTQEYLDVANVMMLALDTGGNITLINPKGCQILEAEAESIIGKNWFDSFLPDEIRDATKSAFDRMIHGDESLLSYYQNPIKTATGSVRTMLFHNSVLRGRGGDVRGTLSSGTDITEQVRAEEEKKSMQAYIYQQEKMASVGQLAAGVAHEINNPMGFITSNLGTLQEYIISLLQFVDAQAQAIDRSECDHGELDVLRQELEIDYIRGDIHELLTDSLAGAVRVKEIVQNLKSFSRLDEESVKPSDINACLENTIKVVWNELKYKATLLREYGDLLPVTCNASQLNQVFVNILVNAAQSIEEHGEIRIKTWQDQEWAYISISDNGSGISEDIKSKIFEPFYTTKEVGKGTGLGLSISYDIIKSHNGNIAIDSTLGKGTCFTISIPIGQTDNS